MPTLSWMGREEATNLTKNVIMKILREDKELSYAKESGRGKRVEHGEEPDLFGRVEVENGRAGAHHSSDRFAAASPVDMRTPCPPPTDNILVHGDNLEALHALLPFYAGQVKCIYIDPPYNTGSTFEHYDDNLEHSTWLNMMYPRLKLLKDFLSEEGSIWISIDDREGAYLKVICDEIFGRCNFVSNISWQRTYSTRNDSKGIVNEVEHILVYSKREGWMPNKLPRDTAMDKNFKNPDNDKVAWTSSDAFAPDSGAHQSMVYGIQQPFNGEMIYPPAGRHWAFEQKQILEYLNEWCPYELRDIDDASKRAELCGISISDVRQGVKAIMFSQSLEKSRQSAEFVLRRGQWPKFYFTRNGKGGIRRKTYLSDVGGVPPSNLFEYKDVGHTDEAKKEILKVFDGKAPFATPKPERLIQRILTIATNPSDLVLDSFLGSGTTAAVAQKMGRRWIGIEMGEHAKTHCAVRLKKVIDGEQGGISKAVNWKGGGSFRYYELGEPILNANGMVTESIDYDTLAAYLWWQRTGTGWSCAHGIQPTENAARSAIAPYQNGSAGAPRTQKSTVLGVHKDVAYALLYNGILGDKRVSGGNVLTKKTLKIILDDLNAATTEEERATLKEIVVYAEATRLSSETLNANKIDFRQTPYDLVVRK